MVESLWTRVRFPLCFVMIWRETLSPMPEPVCLVV